MLRSLPALQPIGQNNVFNDLNKKYPHLLTKDELKLINKFYKHKINRAKIEANNKRILEASNKQSEMWKIIRNNNHKEFSFQSHGIAPNTFNDYFPNIAMHSNIVPKTN